MEGNATLQKTAGLTEERKSIRSVLGGSLAEGVAGGAVIVLSLIGLSHMMPNLMLYIGVIAMGAAFLIEGGAISMRFSKLLTETRSERLHEAELGIGVTAEFLGGVVGLVLGILALLELAPMILAPVAVLVFGAALILGSGVIARLNAFELEGSKETTLFKKVAHEAVSAAAGVQLLIGLSTVILGIVALTGAYTLVLSLVGLLIVGVSGFLDAAALTARMLSLYRG